MSTRVEQAAEYLRTKGQSVFLSSIAGGWMIEFDDNPDHDGIYGEQALMDVAKEAGWGGETVSGSGTTFHVEEGGNG